MSRCTKWALKLILDLPFPACIISQLYWEWQEEGKAVAYLELKKNDCGHGWEGGLKEQLY